MAQLSSASFYFLFIDVDGLDNILPSWSSSTSTSMTMILSTNQRPRKCDKTYRMKERKRDIHLNIMRTYALRAAAVMISNYTNNYQFSTRLCLQNELVEIVHSTKLLGTIVTQDLSWWKNANYSTKELTSDYIY